MIRRVKRTFRPLIFVTPETLSSISELVERFTKTDENSVDAVKANIKIRYFNDDEITCSTVEECLGSPNDRSNRIKTVTVSNDYFSRPHLSVILGGSSYEYVGATLEVVAGPEQVVVIEEAVAECLCSEGDIVDKGISLHPAVLTAMLIFVVHFLLGVYSQEFVDVLIVDGQLRFQVAFAAALFLVIMPGMLTFASIYTLQYKFFGRAVFYWKNGKAVHENKAKLVKWMFFSLPVAIALKIAF